MVDEIAAAESELEGVAPDAWYDRLEREDERLQAELRGLREGDVERGLEVAGILWPYWAARGRLAEGRRWLEDFLTATADRPTVHRAKGVYGAGVLAFLQGESGPAGERLLEVLGMARELEKPTLEADALIGLARVAMFERDPPTMERRAREAADAAQAASDERKHATALHHVGEALRRQGRYDEALPFYHHALGSHRALGDRRSVALELHNLGRLARLAGDTQVAAERFRDSIALAGELRHERLVAYCLLGLATLAADEGDLMGAARLVGAADARLAAVGAALEPEYADERNATVTRAEGALGESDCARELEAGAALGLEESVRAGREGGAQPR